MILTQDVIRIKAVRIIIPAYKPLTFVTRTYVLRKLPCIEMILS